MIKSKAIDSSHFEKEIRDFIINKNIQRSQVINITEKGHFTTLWYWSS